jgi:putative peptidoglycan lipid II flippase
MAAARRPLARAGALLSTAFLASRILGWVRVAVIGGLFGASPQLDAYFAAFRIPDTVYQLAAAGALSSAIVPVASGLLARGEEGRTWRLLVTVAVLVGAAVALLAAAAALTAPVLLPLLAPGFPPPQQGLAVDLTRLLLLSPILLTLGTLATAALNSYGRFTASALAPLAYNVVIIAGALVLGSTVGILGLAVSVVLGAAAHLAIQLPGLMERARHHPRSALWPDLRDPAVGETVGLLLPRSLGLGATQLVFLVNTSLASSLGPGAISVYTVAFTLLQIPIGLIGVPLGTVLLPSLSAAAATGDDHRYANLLGRGTRLLLFATIPLAILGALLAEPLVGVLVGYGHYDVPAVERTAATLTAFFLALVPESLTALLARAFYALHDTRRPVAAALAAVAVDVPAAVALAGPLGTPGLALAIGLGAWLEVGLLSFWLARRLPDLAPGRLARDALLHLAATGGAALVAAPLLRLADLLVPDPGGPHWLAAVVLPGGAGLAAYAALAAFRRAPELAELTPLLPPWIARLANTPQERPR